MRALKLGAVYHPDGNPDYAYVVVHMSDDRITCLLLWSNSSRYPAGHVWDEPLDGFKESIQRRAIRRIA